MNADAMRIGHGFDVHRFAERFDPDRPLVLAGCRIPARMSLLAHSDGDVVLHAVCDAVLGAAAAGDIGRHFPDDDPRHAGADSAGLLRRTLALAGSRGLAVVNADATVIAERPRLAPSIDAMAARLAELLRVGRERVNIKATTAEGLGGIGRAEGIACHSVVLMRADG